MTKVILRPAPGADGLWGMMHGPWVCPMSCEMSYVSWRVSHGPVPCPTALSYVCVDVCLYVIEVYVRVRMYVRTYVCMFVCLSVCPHNTQKHRYPFFATTPYAEELSTQCSWPLWAVGDASLFRDQLPAMLCSSGTKGNWRRKLIQRPVARHAL